LLSQKHRGSEVSLIPILSDGVGGGGGCVHGVGEGKVINNFAYSFAWSLYIMCRDPLQKDKGRGDVFIEGGVCGNGRRGGDVVMVLVVVVVVDVYMGRVKKNLWITLPTLLHGVST
jgi:hypothetical protein